MRVRLVCLLMMLHFSAQAQLKGQALVDSLLTELPKAQADTAKVKILHKVSRVLSGSDPEQALKYANEELALAEKAGWTKGIIFANNNLGSIHQSISDLVVSIKYFTRALEISTQSGDKLNIAIGNGNLGYSHMLKGEFKTAIEYDLKALKGFDELHDTPEYTRLLGNIAGVYMNTGDAPKALECSFKALKLSEDLGYKQYFSSNLGTIGSIYTRQGLYDKALEYYFKALRVNQETGNKTGIANNFSNIGAAFAGQNKDSAALSYLLKAYAMYEALGQKATMARVAGNIGEEYNIMGYYSESINYFQKALEYARITEDRSTESGLMGMIGELYLHLAVDTVHRGSLSLSSELKGKQNIQDSRIPKGKTALLNKARECFREAVRLSVDDRVALRDILKSLALTDSMLGDYKGAYESYLKYVDIRDSLSNGENNVKITNLVTKRELDLKIKQIELNKLLVEKKRNERALFIAGIFLLLIVIAVILKNFSSEKRSNKMLAVEKKRSDDLLLNILPVEVAEELKEKGGADALQYDRVTVMFTDFVNFTQATERMSPRELINELHDCFKAFDEITAKHNIEKIKTIGDAYLAVCGLPVAQPRHAEHIIQAAIEIRAFMEERYRVMGDRTFKMRIGIHTGSVVAGIVGVKKFAYDIWGDAVNIAARMEQSCEVGKINISETTYELVKEYYKCTYRGEIDAKNKGKMKMYYVE